MMNLNFTKYLVFLHIFYIYFLFAAETQSNSLFLVEGIDVTLSIDGTGEIRNRAISLAESDALIYLAKKILTTEDFKKFKNKTDIDANYIVESIEFSNEVLTESFYQASLNINFNPYRTREFFRENNFSFSETQSKPIPFYVALSNHEQYFFVNKEWEENWKNLIISNETLDLNFIELSREKKNNLNLSSFLSLDFITDDNILNQDNIILIWCEPRIMGSKIELNIISKIIINNKSKIMKESFIENFYFNDANYIEKIVTQINDKIYDYWITSTSQSKTLNNFKFRYSSDDLTEWVKIENILQSIESIFYYEIQELESKGVKGEIIFYGDSKKLKLILGEHNIISTDIGSIKILQIDNDK